jgi:predicted DNA-binding transcriptional regulator AlpA
MGIYEPYVNADNAAAHLGTSREQVLRLARQGKLPGHTLPNSHTAKRRTWRFRISEIEAFMNGGGQQ